MAHRNVKKKNKRTRTGGARTGNLTPRNESDVASPIASELPTARMSGSLSSQQEKVGLDELWASLRQGSRNVAGVTWQIAVSVDILVASYAGQLAFSTITPEGLEDIDCEHFDGSKTYVQVKEVAAGKGRLTTANVADVLSHAESSARGSNIALVTDGTLGSGLKFTGWDDFLATQEGKPVEDVVSALEGRGFTAKQARDIVARSRIIHLPWRLRDQTEHTLAVSANIHPTVASYAVSRLNESLSSGAANQRSRTPTNAIRLTISEIDLAVNDAQSSVDVTGLDSAVVAGVCAPADFLEISDLKPEEFYLGVDGHPGHIAAGLDVIRTRELLECVEGAAIERYVLLTGPSGTGKSVLLWRAARDMVPGARIVRVRRLENSQDVDFLVRHVRLLRSSPHAPVVVAADNLGRSGMSAWPQAAEALREQPSTILIGACRAEDFHPSLMNGTVRIVQPHLDEFTAQAIAEQVDVSGIPIRLDVGEAFLRADGLLMEFLALLTTGRRLRQVLAIQATQLQEPGRELQRGLARLLTAAHSVGLSLDADRLGAVVIGLQRHNSQTDRRLDEIGDALSALKDEHIVIQEGRRWRGLHELRSETLTELLHDAPPPTLASTWSTVAAILEPSQAGWFLRRVAEHSPSDLPLVAQAVGDLIASPETTALQAAELLEGAERADNTIYAQTCMPILEASRRLGVSLHDWAFVVYPARNQGMKWPQTENHLIERFSNHCQSVISQLPGRSDVDSVRTASTLASRLDPIVLERLMGNATLAETTRLLEATTGLVPIPVDLMRQVLDRLPLPNDLASADLWARVIKVFSEHLDQEEWNAVLGTVEHRAAMVSRCDPNALAVEVDSVGASVKLTRLLSLEIQDHVLPEWDTPPKNRSNEQANDEAVASAQRLADACPELVTFEIITLTASGKRFKVAGSEPGYKRMPRHAFKDRVGVRRSVGFQAAVQRATAAESWTEVVKEQIDIATRLTSLAEQGISRLSAFDNEGRRRQWNQDLATARARASTIAARPAVTGIDPEISQARADDSDRESDPISRALDLLAQKLSAVAGDGKRLAIAMTLRDAAKDLEKSQSEGNPIIEQLGSPIPNSLIAAVRRLAGVAAVLDRDASVARRIRGADTRLIADALIQDAVEAHLTQQRDILSSALLPVLGAQLHRVIDPDAATWSLDDTAWVVTAPVEMWGQMVQALRTIDDKQRQEIGCRVVVIAHEDPDPVHGAQTMDNSSGLPKAPNALPIAIQMGLSADRPEHPMTVDAIAPLIQEAGFSIRTGNTSTTLAQIINDLVVISWECARRSLRTTTLPGPRTSQSQAQTHQSESDLEHVRLRAKQATALLSGDAAVVAGEALNVLFDHVAQELAGATSVALAGELFDQFGRSPHEVSPAPHLVEALSQLSLAGLYEA